MLKLLVVLLSAFACSTSLTLSVIEPEDEILSNYKRARARLTPDQEEFLMELLAADDALIAAATGRGRGVVDDILQAVAGAGLGSVNLNLVGGANPAQQQQAPLNPSLTFALNGQPLVGNAQAQAPAAAASQPTYLQGGAAGAPLQGAAPQGPGGAPINVGSNNNHLFSTISSVIRNSNTRNVTGIVDQSLRIATPAPIREFVTGILGVVYCNGIRRLLGRC